MAESMLLGVLGKDFGDGVFKYLAPRTTLAACRLHSVTLDSDEG